jgi:hypothetical protein
MSYVRFSVIAVALAAAGCSSEMLTQAPPYQTPPVGFSTYPSGSIFTARPLPREAAAPSTAPGVASSGSSGPTALAPAEEFGKTSDCGGPVTAGGRRSTTTALDCAPPQAQKL